ncbi:hypothetical protein ACSVIJ_05155 [Pseudomonas sp. NCHU5208]|uniref:hypothetical protein n=1 Tax=unclassified Pseudomonas TaxID=196821 RepID=UPI003F9E349D
MLRPSLLIGIALVIYLGQAKSTWLYAWIGMDTSTDPARLCGMGFFAVISLTLALLYRLLPLNDLFFRFLPRVWGRWWSARLIATTACSGQLHAGNPEFTTWQSYKRNALCLVLFILPGRLPVSINKQSIAPLENRQ